MLNHCKINTFVFPFRAKVTKYGDRLLETIEATLKEYHAADNRNSGGSNDSVDSAKRRREANGNMTPEYGEDDDFTRSTGHSRKRATTITEAKDYSNHKMEQNHDIECLGDLDFEDSVSEFEINASNVNNAGRVLPPWLKS